MTVIEPTEDASRVSTENRSDETSEVYPKVPMSRTVFAVVIAVVAFYLSQKEVIGVSLDFLRILICGAFTYIALCYAINIKKYPEAPHNQPRPGFIQSLRRPAQNEEEEEGRALRGSIARTVRAMRRADTLTRWAGVAVAGCLATAYFTYDALKPVGEYFGLF